MALPHYSEDQTSKKGRNFEPVQANLFEVTILPPDGVAGQEFLLQHVNSISGLDTMAPAVDAIGQKYKFADRSYAGMPGATSIDITVTIVIVQFNREGDIYRKVTLDDCFITSGVNLLGELSYESADAVALEVGWKCDTFSEELN